MTTSDCSQFTSGNQNLRIRVLLIDDYKLIGKMVGKIVSSESDMDFEYCSDPLLGLETALEFKPTIILLDLIMPKMGGLELLKIFRTDKVTKDVPIIILSGKEEADTKAQAFAQSANDYLVKLPDIVELIARIRHHSTGYIRLLQLNDAICALQDSQQKLELRSRFIKDTFGKFLSDEVVAGLLDNPEGVQLGGQQKIVTILMSDLRGFTSMSERLSAEKTVQLINNFLGTMADIVLRWNGTIIEFLGDAIFAVFGAPLNHGNDAANAIACSLEMQLAMEQVNTLNREQGLPEVEMGIGLNTGQVAVGNIGSERRIKYGVVGKHVNLASRIESYTIGRQLLVSESTLEAAGHIVLKHSEMTVMPKGVKEPITIYDIVGIGGEYNVYLPEVQPESLYIPPQEFPVRFSVSLGKDSGNRYRDGTIRAFSMKEAEVRSLVDIPLHSNIKFNLVNWDGVELPGDIYAKSVMKIDGGFLMHFTALPPNIEQFLRGLLYFHKK
jgi:adenylate cyclase